jgi:formylglycine-generating enzyme required for sulfatase activity
MMGSNIKYIAFTILMILGILQPLYAQQDSGREGQKVINALGMEFVLIEAGSMVVGKIEIECPTGPDTREVNEEDRWTEEDFELCRELAKRDSRPGFLVTVDQPYYMGKYEVTQGQWEKVMGNNPSFFQGLQITGNPDLHPVENVTWEMAQEFIQRLNKLDTSAVYRLPKEFEWEYAARAGADSLLSWPETGKHAWIQKTDKGTTQAVGQMKPNAWGLYDMLGNVWEWVEDYYNDKVFAEPIPPTSGEIHVLRGGSFISDVTNATYFFHGGGPGNGYDVGFRIVKEVK